MAFDRKRRIKLAATTGAVIFIIFAALAAVVAMSWEPVGGAAILGFGTFVGLLMFALVAVTKPQKDDE